MARSVKKPAMKKRKRKKPKKPIGSYFRFIVQDVVEQAKFTKMNRKQLKRELYGRYLRFRNEGSYSSWNRAVKAVFGVGVRRLPDLRQGVLWK